MTIPVWWWLIGLALAASMALAVASRLGLWPGVGASALFVLGIGAVLWGYGSATVEVNEGAFVAGRARIEWQYVGEATALDADETARVLGVNADTTSFLVTRPYIKRAVLLRVDDAADPHRHWVVSSRHPELVAKAAATHLPVAS